MAGLQIRTVQENLRTLRWDRVMVATAASAIGIVDSALAASFLRELVRNHEYPEAGILLSGALFAYCCFESFRSEMSKINASINKEEERARMLKAFIR